MNFDFNQEQRMLQDSVARFIQDNYDLASRIKSAGSKFGFSRDHWHTMAELGWLGLPFEEADG
ncbi:MAG: acyl-CoA dehydrogenase family protein, partial [Gammaproteobacteria bacterium]|nr:acyl-CoA dehydrogenase family protein [Gammaproteobacteria bacterium]